MKQTTAVSLLILTALLSGTAAAEEHISGVTLFMAPWCSYCMGAKGYLAAHDIPYREFDVDTPSGQKAFEETGGTRGVSAGKRGIPFLVWKGEQIRGFTASRYDTFFALSE
jgi:glutaredoxin